MNIQQKMQKINACIKKIIGVVNVLENPTSLDDVLETEAGKSATLYDKLIKRFGAEVTDKAVFIIGQELRIEGYELGAIAHMEVVSIMEGKCKMGFSELTLYSVITEINRQPN